MLGSAKKRGAIVCVELVVNLLSKPMVAESARWYWVRFREPLHYPGPTPAVMGALSSAPRGVRFCDRQTIRPTNQLGRLRSMPDTGVAGRRGGRRSWCGRPSMDDAEGRAATCPLPALARRNRTFEFRRGLTNLARAYARRLRNNHLRPSMIAIAPSMKGSLRALGMKEALLVGEKCASATPQPLRAQSRSSTPP